MKILAIAATLGAATTGASAQSIVEHLCGVDHQNEIRAENDVRANPDGFYITSLNTQIRLGDPRLINAVGDDFYLCTRSAATPAMDQAQADAMADKRVVKYLFVPAIQEIRKPSS